MADTVGYSDSVSFTFPDWQVRSRLLVVDTSSITGGLSVSQALTFAVDCTGKRAVLAV